MAPQWARLSSSLLHRKPPKPSWGHRKDPFLSSSLCQPPLLDPDLRPREPSQMPVGLGSSLGRCKLCWRDSMMQMSTGPILDPDCWHINPWCWNVVPLLSGWENRWRGRNNQCALRGTVLVPTLAMMSQPTPAFLAEDDFARKDCPFGALR